MGPDSERVPVCNFQINGLDGMDELVIFLWGYVKGQVFSMNVGSADELFSFCDTCSAGKHMT
jgi:hypothetical protein